MSETVNCIRCGTQIELGDDTYLYGPDGLIHSCGRARTNLQKAEQRGYARAVEEIVSCSRRMANVLVSNASPEYATLIAVALGAVTDDIEAKFGNGAA